MPRYRITVEYDGGPFAGWQRQSNGFTVQEALEVAIARLSGEEPTVQGAGRTDAGVHASGQVAHFDLSKAWPADRLRDGLNAHLRPHPVSVLQASTAPDDFHARFSATARRYCYRILNRRAPPALERGKVWHVSRPLDAGAMHESARHLVGRHDFTTFRSSECQSQSPVKTLDELSVSRLADEIMIVAGARSFLHNQVRSMVGSLKLVGEGKWPVNGTLLALKSRDRSRCGPVAPPDGLCLERVEYGDVLTD